MTEDGYNSRRNYAMWNVSLWIDTNPNLLNTVMEARQ